ncbi:MAG TPA: heme o synthase [Acidimicrobiia bacterium]|nr:heme o synthase [Acidimicrobiia bacterium]
MSTPRVTITDPRGPGPAVPERLRAWVALMKPRIIELLLITTVPAMILAEGGWPDTWLVVATVVGGTLSAGGANAINNVADRDLDAKMRRTAHRPLPAHRVGPTEALVVGLVAGAAGFAILAAAVNLASALLATGALAFYVFVYTLLLKRSTAQNIVIGGAAGAVPVLVGWAAVTGGVGLPAWVMFAVVFFWTPPHFWALSLRFREDYERAGVPMLPVVAGVAATVRQIGMYSILLAGVSLLLQPVAGLGMVYLGAASLLGAWFIVEAARLAATPDRAILVFRASNIYLTLLFAAIAVDVLV